MAGPRIVVVMGVAGCGKTTVGRALAASEGGAFIDGDDLHPPENVAKMREGTPLTDDDRWPWLDRLGAALAERASQDGLAFAACSALRRAYRDRLRQALGEPALFVHLEGERQLIRARMAARLGHYMPTALLDSQFATLEPLAPDEPLGETVAVTGSPEEVVAAALKVVRHARD